MGRACCAIMSIWLIICSAINQKVSSEPFGVAFAFSRLAGLIASLKNASLSWLSNAFSHSLRTRLFAAGDQSCRNPTAYAQAVVLPPSRHTRSVRHSARLANRSPSTAAAGAAEDDDEDDLPAKEAANALDPSTHIFTMEPLVGSFSR